MSSARVSYEVNVEWLHTQRDDLQADGFLCVEPSRQRDVFEAASSSGRAESAQGEQSERYCRVASLSLSFSTLTRATQYSQSGRFKRQLLQWRNRTFEIIEDFVLMEWSYIARISRINDENARDREYYRHIIWHSEIPLSRGYGSAIRKMAAVFASPWPQTQWGDDFKGMFGILCSQSIKRVRFNDDLSKATTLIKQTVRLHRVLTPIRK